MISWGENVLNTGNRGCKDQGGSMPVVCKNISEKVAR